MKRTHSLVAAFLLVFLASCSGRYTDLTSFVGGEQNPQLKAAVETAWSELLTKKVVSDFSVVADRTGKSRTMYGMTVTQNKDAEVGVVGIRRDFEVGKYDAAFERLLQDLEE